MSDLRFTIYDLRADCSRRRKEADPRFRLVTSAATKSQVAADVRRRFWVLGLALAFSLQPSAFSQVVTGPLSSTPSAIPTFVDASGKRITNNPALLYTNGVLNVNGVPQAQNSYTTNSVGKAPTPLTTTTSALWPLMVLDPGGSFGDRTISYAPNFYMSNGVAHFAGNVNVHTVTGGSLLQANGGQNISAVTVGSGLDFTAGTLSSTGPSGSGTANTIAQWSSGSALTSLANGAEGTVLGISNGLPAYVNASGGSTITNTFSTVVITNSYIQTNNYTVGKGGHLTITNSFTIQTNGTLNLQNLPVPSVLVLATNQAVTNATLSGLTLSDANVLTASGGGGLDTSVTTLGWSGTNLTGFNCATNGATFKVTLTNNAFLGTSSFSNLPDTATMKQWTLLVQEDSTGGYYLNMTNSIVSAADGVIPVTWTNASGITWYYFHTDLTTNNTLAVIANVNVHR